MKTITLTDEEFDALRTWLKKTCYSKKQSVAYWNKREWAKHHTANSQKELDFFQPFYEKVKGI